MSDRNGTCAECGMQLLVGIGHYPEDCQFAKLRAERNALLLQVERMRNVVDAACALESFFGHDDLNSAYRNRREATDAFVKAVAVWKTWLPEKRIGVVSGHCPKCKQPVDNVIHCCSVPS